jgi:hypothetical protein
MKKILGGKHISKVVINEITDNGSVENNSKEAIDNLIKMMPQGFITIQIPVTKHQVMLNPSAVLTPYLSDRVAEEWKKKTNKEMAEAMEQEDYFISYGYGKPVFDSFGSYATFYFKAWPLSAIKDVPRLTVRSL